MYLSIVHDQQLQQSGNQTSGLMSSSLLANGTTKTSTGVQINCAKECPCGVPVIPVPDQWLEVMVTGGFKVWHIIFIIIAFVVTTVVVYCCFHRCRIPRTKQEIEADLMRSNLANRFRDYLQELPNEPTTFVEALKRVQDIEEKLEADDAQMSRDLGARKRMGWLKLRGKDKGAQKADEEPTGGPDGPETAQAEQAPTEPALGASVASPVIQGAGADKFARLGSQDEPFKLASEPAKQPSLDQAKSKSKTGVSKKELASTKKELTVVATAADADKTTKQASRSTITEQLAPPSPTEPSKKIRRNRRDKPNLKRTKTSRLGQAHVESMDQASQPEPAGARTGAGAGTSDNLDTPVVAIQSRRERPKQQPAESAGSQSSSSKPAKGKTKRQPAPPPATATRLVLVPSSKHD